MGWEHPSLVRDLVKILWCVVLWTNKLLASALAITSNVSPIIDFETFSDVLYGGDTFFVDGITLGPYSRQPGDETVLEGDVCNSMVKQLFVYEMAGSATLPTFIPTTDYGSDPLLDWGPFCQFFIPTPVVVGTSLIALWITLGCVGIVLIVSCCCCFLFCWLLLLLGLLLTRQRKSAKTYRILKDKAEEASRLKSLFVSHMSHELRTPLNSLIGTIDLVKDTPMSDDQLRSMDVISSSSGLLLDIVNDVLFAANLAAGEIENDLTEVCLPSVVDAVMRAAANSTSKVISYLIYYLPGTPFTVFVDRRRLAQVLMNLVGNATKFTNEGHIRLVVGPPSSFTEAYSEFIPNGSGEEPVVDDPGATLVFQLDDSGIGIKQEDYTKVFDRFTRLQNDQGSTGTGLGLHIAQTLVKTILHGSIAASSSPDLGGARFTFTSALPIVDSPAPLAEIEAAPVVLIDDTPTMAHGHAMLSLLLLLGLPADSLFLGTQPSPPTQPTQPPHVIVCHPVTDPVSYLAAVRKEYGGGRVTFALDDISNQQSVAIDVIATPFSAEEVIDLFAGKATPVARSGPEMVVGDLCHSVIIAEDDPVNRQMLSAFFRRINATSHLFETGNELLDGLDPDNPPTLAVLDYHMPGMTGEECARVLRERYGSGLAIVLMTADVTVDDVGKLYDIVMYKPVRFASFVDVLQRLTTGVERGTEARGGRA